MTKSNSSRSGWKTWSSAKRSWASATARLKSRLSPRSRRGSLNADLVHVPFVVVLEQRVVLLGLGEGTELDLRAGGVVRARRSLGLEDEDLVEVVLPLEVLLDEAFDTRDRRL
jgi:hypothetical protein